MSTQAVNNSTSGPTQYRSKSKEMQTEDFIRMMIVQLQNQDPFQPQSNQELMQQMSQISQLESSTKLQDTLQMLASQSQIGAAGNLIGKVVEGLDDDNEKIQGLVASVRVEGSDTYLELSSGKRLKLSNVTAIAEATAGVETAT